MKQLICLQDLIDIGCGLFPRAGRYVEKGLYRVGATRYSSTRSLKQYATHTTARPGRVRIRELARLETAVARGKGVILWESPFGHPLLGKATLIERGYSLIQVHGPEHGGSMSWVGQHVVKPFHRRISRRLFHEIVEINYQSLAYLRQVDARLKANQIVCIRAFGQAGQKFVTTPFKGGVAYVPTGIISLVRRTNSTLLGMFCYTEDGVDHLELSELFPMPGEDQEADPVAAIATRYLTKLGAMIDRHPEQWWGVPERPSPGRNRAILNIEPE